MRALAPDIISRDETMLPPGQNKAKGPKTMR